MYTDTVLRNKGLNVLIDNLGKVDAERFISLINHDTFDYTEWRKDLFNNLSVKELSALAMQEYKNGDK
ncbi:hypothetical protein NO1_1883 [Candidatus Termititenax aidoneus]|uniref:Uncharacterized protein n=1 Tax=Termititenax aidoneus TaxID=2218524 RepID=A0A388TCZ2_TERA1|nr:hypothetical protein NO1_1883 [Candidatus Termititenax aidoneus]